MSEFMRLAVIGHPITHSKSPLIHNYWIKNHGLNGIYEAIDFAPDDLGEGIKRLIDEGYSGFNFTIPHKESALSLCDDLDPMAQMIGAVNTFVVRDGRSIGLNTDAFGFLENIRQGAPDFNFQAGAAVVLGAGGAARAVLAGLMDAKVPEIILINRSQDKAQNLADQYEAGQVKVLSWDMRHEALSNVNLLVNTTSLGMDGQAALEIDLSCLSPEALVNDIVYAPLYTPLLKAAEARGNIIVTGIGMLLHQARPAFQAWFGIMPEVDEGLIRVVHGG